MADRRELEMIRGVAAALTETQRDFVAAMAQAPPDPVDPQHRMLAPSTRALLVEHGVFDRDGYLTPFGVRVGLVFADLSRAEVNAPM